MDEPLTILGILAVIGLITWFNIAWFAKAKQLIRQWASDNHYNVVSIEYRLFRKGPFTWNSSKGQLVYFVSLSTTDGPRKAFIRCGSFWAGMLSDNVEVVWEEAAANQ